MRRGFATIFCSVQEYFFPLFCLSCNREGVWICDDCFAHQVCLDGVFSCPICHAESSIGSLCSGCMTQGSIDRHAAMMPYQEHTLIAELLHALKYQFAESTLSLFDLCIKKFIEQQSAWFLGIDVIVPIPLHRKRFAERGFNQAEKIAELLSAHTKIPLLRVVSRKRNTLQQALLSRDDREKNVAEAFVASVDCSGKKILLVDDVYTTGSTMQSCAAAVRARGAKEVRGWTVARG